MSVYPELDNPTLDDLIACWHAAPPDGPEFADTYYGEVAAQLREQGPAGINFLLDQAHQQMQPDGDAARLRAALLGLTLPPRLEDPRLPDLLFTCLRDPRPLVVAEAVDGLWNRGDTDALVHVLILRNHPSPYVRSSVLRFMSHLYPREALPLLLEALHDEDPIVRENAIDELDELGVEDAGPAIQQRLNDQDPQVRQAAQAALTRMA